MTTLDSRHINVRVTGAPGEAWAAAARRTQAYGPTAGLNDAQLLDLFADYVILSNPGFKGDTGAKGDPGGSVGDDVGLATALGGINIPAPINRVATSGYDTLGRGSAIYVSDALATPALAAAHPRAVKVDGTGRRWRLAPEAGVILPEMLGAAGDGAADDLAAIQATIDYAAAVGLRRLALPASYRITGPFTFTNAIQVDAGGGTIRGDFLTSAAMAQVVADNVTVNGGQWVVVSGGDQPWVFNIVGKNCRLFGVTLGALPDRGGYQMYVRYGADGFKMYGCNTFGCNGIFNEASDVVYGFNQFEGRLIGGDDAIALKAIQGVTEQVRIIGNSFRNLATYCSIGSEIGNLGGDDPLYEHRVRGVTIVGNTGFGALGILFIKPGAVGAYDYCDGIVEDIVCSDNTLNDEGAIKFNRAVAITASRGAIVRRVYGDNNVVTARTQSLFNNVGGGDYFNTDNRAATAGTGEPQIYDCDVEVIFTDPGEGVAAGGAFPGNPAAYIFRVENQEPTYGEMRNIVIRGAGDGCALSGIRVGPGLDDAVTIRKFHGRNLNVTGGGMYGGIEVESRVQVETDVRMENVGNAYYLGSTLLYRGVRETVPYCELIPSNVDTHRVPWVANRRCLINEIGIVTPFAIPQSDVDYVTLALRHVGGSGTGTPYVAVNTTLAGANIPANAYTILFGRQNGPEGQFDLNDSLVISNTQAGAGRAIQFANLVVTSLPY